MAGYEFSSKRLRTALILGGAVLALGSCRNDPRDASQQTVAQFGDPGSGYTVQCSGWFPDWISQNPPSAETAFQLSQGYWRGIPVRDPDTNELQWERPEPATNRPWQAHDFRIAAEQQAYSDSLIDYAYGSLRGVDFDANKLKYRTWFHAPMMHTNPTRRREPLKGVTSERGLRPDEYSWVTSFLRTYAVGYYDMYGSYTLGQVFNSPDPTLADPTAGEFVDGAFVFKLIFSEYDPAKINAAQDPLDGAPQWEIQDVDNPNGPLITVRLTQIDVAVKDARATETGWVFATFGYDKSLNASEPDPWRRLSVVGLQWGADGTASPGGTGSVQESWINPGQPAVWAGHVGLGGRLNGPIDNPASSCMSCHSTAQVVASISSGGGSLAAFSGAPVLPPNSCSTANSWQWYRNLANEDPFGIANNATCTVATPPGTPASLAALDYSLQLKEGLVSALFYRNANPCQALVMSDTAVDESKQEASERSLVAPIGEKASGRRGLKEVHLRKPGITPKFKREEIERTLDLDYSDQASPNPR